jgi:hypothetical protein
MDTDLLSRKVSNLICCSIAEIANALMGDVLIIIIIIIMSYIIGLKISVKRLMRN